MQRTRYLPSRNYLPAALIAMALAVLSAWFGWNWTPAYLPAGLFILSAGLLFFLASRPPIELTESHLAVGRRTIPWNQVCRVDSTGYTSPLIVYLTLQSGRRTLLIYPGDLDCANSLLRQIRRASREALIDGIPYRQFWGEAVPFGQSLKPLASPRYRLLRPEDEADVERLYQRLKTVGHLDPKSSSEEK